MIWGSPLLPLPARAPQVPTQPPLSWGCQALQAAGGGETPQAQVVAAG